MRVSAQARQVPATTVNAVEAAQERDPVQAALAGLLPERPSTPARGSRGRIDSWSAIQSAQPKPTRGSTESVESRTPAT